MAKVKKFSGKKLDELYEIYDKARTVAKEAELDKKEASDNIKELLGDVESASTPNYIVTYGYDKDRELSTFDEERFAEKDPQGYKVYSAFIKKYTTSTVVKGARKLIVTALAE